MRDLEANFTVDTYSSLVFFENACMYYTTRVNQVGGIGEGDLGRVQIE